MSTAVISGDGVESRAVDARREVPETLQTLAISVGLEVGKVAKEQNVPASRLADLVSMVKSELGEEFESDDWGWVGGILVKEVPVVLDIEPPEQGDDPPSQEASQSVAVLKRLLEAELTLAYHPGDDEVEPKDHQRHWRVAKREASDNLWAERLSPFAVMLPKSFEERYLAVRVEYRRSRSQGSRRWAGEYPGAWRGMGDPPGAGIQRATVVSRESEIKEYESGPRATVMSPETEVKEQESGPKGIREPPRLRELTEEAVEKIRKAAEATKPPPGGMFKIGDDIDHPQTLSDFRAYFETVSSQRAWTVVHEFFWLAKFVDTPLWLNISKTRGRKLLANPLCRASYSEAVEAIWKSLRNLSGADKEREALLREAQQLVQRKGEGVMAYLYRVNDYKLKCEIAGVCHETPHWLSVSRVGMREDLVKKLSYLVHVGDDDLAWGKWLTDMERMSSSAGSGVRVVECSETVESQVSLPPPKIQERDARARIEGQAEKGSAAAGSEPRKPGQSAFKGRCFLCHQSGHMKRECPHRDKYRAARLTATKEVMAAEEFAGKREQSRQESGEAAGVEESQKTMKITSAAFAADCHAASSAVLSFALGGADEVPQVTLQGGSHNLVSLLDTGSSCTLISKVVADELREEGRAVRVGKPPVVIRYANGEEEKADGEIIIRVSLNGSDCFLPCLVVKRLGRDGLILGRRALRLLGMSIEFAQDSPAERARLRRAFEDRVAVHAIHDDLQPLEEEAENRLCATVDCYKAEGELFVPDEEDRALQCMDDTVGRSNFGERDVLDIRVDSVLSRKKEEAGLKTSTDLDEEAIIKDLLEAVVQEGPVQLAEGYTLKLSRESVDGMLTDGQRYQFVAQWNLRDHGGSVKPWSSGKMIANLLPLEKEEFDGHCREYEAQGWWFPEKSEVTQRQDAGKWQCPYGTIFPVRQAAEGLADAGVVSEGAVCKTTKTRPVADLRPINGASPPVSNQQSTTAEAARILRSKLKKGDIVRQFDLTRAFYCIGVEPITESNHVVPLRLAVAHRRFLCRRLAFGLACGPLVLRSSQRVVLKVVEAARVILGYSSDVSVTVVMDDFIVWGDEAAVRAVELLLLKAWQLTGFLCPEQKRTQWGSIVPTRWLGSGWIWDGDRGILSLVRPNAVEENLSIDINRLTKRQVFKLAGRYVEISGGVNESLARAHADCARVLASVEAAWDSVDSEGSWKKPASVHLGLAQRYWVEAKRVEDSDLRLFKGLEHLIADVDASAGGYGFVWRDPEGRVVRAEARVQSKSMALGSWHCNRRELFVIAACLRRLDEEIPLFSDLKRVEIRGDSRVAVRQADPWNVPACKSMERRAILRLRGVVAEATHALKCGTPSVTVTFAHLPGVSNDIADALSRVSLTSKYIPVLEKREAVILAGCAAVEAHSWLADEAGGIHSIASVQRWRRLRACFFALKGVGELCGRIFLIVSVDY
ncbi:hypothetical protein Pmar_PMAR022782 [Perkinsus marinus ATCC 50983]|uniref:CCHC-type domain-containing protein n=1 Tax=Perkinsus marinus (strain ATCC 50983 / TXsc) TaxID=423536 RepID=C5LSX3_PERM5|nr:hypothetical protein Pmar_PMAR022782 [Perkinsus marinus ATCC 50983]EER00170.1 hypothetical protein Pmar_PMAR022782 [Perkinsus marinus ATCC 50983]|eukprot:XP_002767452.1 hypothetical protein Pmar_PMAR022782 [Perkinsus marinus ATCC 50983]